MTENTLENLDEFSDEVLQEQFVADSLAVGENIQVEAMKGYVPIDIRV